MMKSIMTDQDEDKKHNDTKIGIHSVRNLLGSLNQLDMFSDHHVKFGDEYGVEVDKSIDQIGMDLTDIQSRVMEGILRGFSQTNYKGNIAPKKKEEIAQKYSGKLPATYKYIRELPQLRATQKQIIEWAGLSTGSAGDKQRATEALNFLGRQQFYLFYKRLAYDEAGRPERDKKGNWKKEDVEAVDTLFDIRTIREDSDKKTPDESPRGDVKYYEIAPSTVFLDQIETYFILMPYNWRDEIEALYRGKYSAYIPRFIYFLRLQYEFKRRSAREEKPFQLKWSPEEIALYLRMPKTVYQRNKAKMNSLLEEAYSVAKKLGYLQSYERTGAQDILTFQDSKFVIAATPTLEQAIAMSSKTSPAQLFLFDIFHSKKKELNEYHIVPEGQEKEDQLMEFHQLLNHKKTEDVEALINWGLSLKYWCERLSSPRKLRENFDVAWTEMNATKKQPGNTQQEHYKIAKALRLLMQAQRSEIEVSPFADHMELRNANNHVKIVEYKMKDFRVQVESFLQKLNIPTAELAHYYKSIS